MGPELSMTQPDEALLDYEGLQLYKKHRSQMILPR